MPREDRRITFDFSEAYKAIYALCVQNQVAKPQPGMITEIKKHPAEDSKVMVRIENGHDKSVQYGEFSRDFLAAALMLYCRTLRIPLPKTATKSVEFIPDGVILRVQI